MGVWGLGFLARASSSKGVTGLIGSMRDLLSQIKLLWAAQFVERTSVEFPKLDLPKSLNTETSARHGLMLRWQGWLQRGSCYCGAFLAVFL